MSVPMTFDTVWKTSEVTARSVTSDDSCWALMTAYTLFSTLHALHVRLTPFPDGTLRVHASPGVLTDALQDAIRQHKAALLDLVEDFEERAAIAEYCGGLPRADAEAQAWACFPTQTLQDAPGCVETLPASSAPLALSPPPPCVPGTPQASLPGLRPYQAEAVTACQAALTRGEHPVLALPTGSGKSHILAALAAALEGRVLVVTHRKELIAQDHAKHLGDDAGIYSAGLGVRDEHARVLYAGVASVYRRMEALQVGGMFRYVMIDEAHRIVPDCGQEIGLSMYGQILVACPDAQRIGVTATPYRLNEGPIYAGEGAWFSTLAFDVSLASLTPEYLAPLVGVQGARDIDVRAVKIRMGDYVLSELSQVACEESVVEGAVCEMIALLEHRHRCLVFCVDVRHTELVCQRLQAHGQAAVAVVGTTPQATRDARLHAFAHGDYKYLINCEIATTGYDCPAIDAVVLLRPTQSKGLLVQMLGRGSRQAPDKRDAVILDYAGNLARHAPLDEVPTVSPSPERHAADVRKAIELAAAEQVREAKHDRTVLGEAHNRQTYRVTGVRYAIVQAKKSPRPWMLLATYQCPERSGTKAVTHFVCVEHQGWAREQAVAWARRRHLVCPGTARALRFLVDAAPIPVEVVVDEQGQYPRIVVERFAEAS